MPVQFKSARAGIQVEVRKNNQRLVLLIATQL